MGMVLRLVILLVIVLSLSMTSAAQQLPDPAPAWPADGVIPEALKAKYVFVDAAKNEFVLAYPENLGTPAFEKDGPGAMKISRYELLRSVEPSVSLAVAPGAGGKYKYVYTIENGAPAKQSIDQFSIVAPEQIGDAIKGPEGWFAIVQKGRTFKVQDAELVRSGAAAVWSFHKPEELIQPGAKKTGFELETELRPGITVGYFRKAESVEVKVAASGNIPAPVKEQKDELLSLEHNSKTIYVLGPKFAADVDSRAIATDFVEGINALGRAGTLNPESAFVKSALTELNRVVGAGGPANFTVQPSGDIETSLLNAMKVSLSR